MGNWRDLIIKEFVPNVCWLTLVADPDGLLLEEDVLAGIRHRGFELIVYEDPVAFRFDYESKFRCRRTGGERAELVIVVPPSANELERLPFDVLQNGRRLSFSLGEIFPTLSYLVVTALDTRYLDALHNAQERLAPGMLGDNATKEFVLRQVFDIDSE